MHEQSVLKSIQNYLAAVKASGIVVEQDENAGMAYIEANKALFDLSNEGTPANCGS